MPSKNFLISFLFTVVDCWRRAAGKKYRIISQNMSMFVMQKPANYMHVFALLGREQYQSSRIHMHETSRFSRNFSHFHNFLPDLETNSMSFPSRISSSFCAVEALHVTPGNMTTFRVNFSPKKFLTSTFVKLGSIATLIGK